MFALDVFEGGYGMLGTMVALFMHLIPSFILLACLVLAWRKPAIGGAIFLALGVLFTIIYLKSPMPVYALMISVPLLVIGALFIINGVAKGGRHT